MGVKNKFLEIRLQKGYKFQKDFADYLGINRSQYNKYEKNKEQPSLEVLYALAKKLNCHMEELIYMEEDKSND